MAAGDLEHLLRKAADNGYIMVCWNRGTYRYYHIDTSYVEADSYETCVRLAAANGREKVTNRDRSCHNRT